MGQQSDKAYSAAIILTYTVFTALLTGGDPSQFNFSGDNLTDTNLAQMYQNGIEFCRWGDAHLHSGNPYFGSTQAGEVDYTVLSPNGNPSMKVYCTSLEIDYNWIHVHPGDRVLFKCYIKTPEGSSLLPYGANIGFDFYGGSYSLDGVPSSGSEFNYYSGTNYNPTSAHSDWVSSPAGAYGYNVMFIRWGTSDWVQMTYDVLIPDYAYTKCYYIGYPYTISPTYIDGIFPWIGSKASDDNAGDGPDCWFADAELYINPSDPFVEQVQTPVFSPVSGVYGSTQTVTISSATSGASIYYTNDSSTPTSASNTYTVPLSIASTTTLKALATKTSYTDSAVGSAVYTINNPVTPSAAAVRAHLAMLRRR